jgi:hypothetical protein
LLATAGASLRGRTRKIETKSSSIILRLMVVEASLKLGRALIAATFCDDRVDQVDASVLKVWSYLSVARSTNEGMAY